MAGKKVNRLIVPNVYTVNGVEPVTSVNNILPINGNVTLPIPTVPTNVSAFTNDAGYLTSATLDGYATQSWVQQQGYLTSVPSQYITDTELSTTLADYVTSSSLSTTLNSYATVTSLSTETSNRMDADDSLQLQINDKYDASNPDGFISGISRSDVITALGYTPYNSSNPNGYITSAALSDYVTDTDLATTLADYAQTTDIPTVGNGTITINQGGVLKGTFTVNQSGNSTINLDAVGSVNSVNGQTGTVVLTASDVGALPDSTTIPTKTSDLTNDSGFITSSALTPYALSSSLATVATSGSYSDLSNKPTIPAAQVQSDWNQTDNTAVDFIKNRPTIPSGVVVDQTYDSTSANAQSGVAIAGAGFLTSIPSGYLQNTATGTYSLSILGNASSARYATTVGTSSSASKDKATAFGSFAVASGLSSTVVGFSNYVTTDYATVIGSEANTGDYGISIGYHARSTQDSSIQLGYGTNYYANTLSVGFYNTDSTHYNWQLLDGTTGLIPDERISSNIARVSNIPTVPTNISAFTNDVGYTTNVGTVTSVNNSQPDANGNVTLSIPTVPTNVSAFTNDSGYQTSSDVNTAVTNAISTLLGNLYPVGSVYIGTQATCPLQALGIGTWQLVSSGRVLQGADANNTAGSTVNASLPSLTTNSQGDHSHNRGTMNISGGPLTIGRFASSQSNTSGALKTTSGTSRGTGYYGSTTSVDSQITLTASSNWTGTTNTTGAHTHTAEWTGHVGTTVQPDAYIVNIWERIA